MAIDVFAETVVTFAEAASRLPRLRHGRKISMPSLYRWAQAGRRSPDGCVVRLETVKIGGSTCTSLEALQRFFDRLTGDISVVTPPSRTQRQRLLAIERAERELNRAGI